MKADSKNILIPADFGKQSHKAIHYSNLLNKKVKGKIHLLHHNINESEIPVISITKQSAEERDPPIIHLFLIHLIF